MHVMIEIFKEEGGLLEILYNAIICPIAYSMGQIIKSVCACLSVCPSVGTLTVAFLGRCSQT